MLRRCHVILPDRNLGRSRIPENTNLLAFCWQRGSFIQQHETVFRTRLRWQNDCRKVNEASRKYWWF